MNRRIFFWYAWFFLWIALSFNLGSHANYLLAEKGLYLSSLGPCVLLATAVCSLGKWRPAGIALLLVLAGWQAGQVAGRAPYWANTVVYLENIMAFEPNYDVAHYQRAVLALRSGEYAVAVEQLEKVVELRPDLRKNLDGTLATAYAEWGRALAEERRFAEALTALQKALRHDPQRSTTWNALGVVNSLRGEQPLAVSNWQKAVALDPRNVEALGNLQMYGPKAGASAVP
jgi:tetratricopeptide (TPR) repeat protein